MADWDSWGATPSNPPASEVCAGWDDTPVSASQPQPAPPNGSVEPPQPVQTAPYSNQNPSQYDSRPPAAQVERPTDEFSGPSSYTRPPSNHIQPASSVNGWNAVPPSNSQQSTNPQQQVFNGPLQSPDASASPNAIPANWGGIPPPTFSPGPRSTASHPSNGQIPSAAAPVQSNITSGGWKITAPSFVPRSQAGHPGQGEPAISLNTFLEGAQGSKWAAENIPPPSFGTPASVSNTAPASNTAGGPVAVKSEQPTFAPPPSFNQPGANSAPTQTTTINGWTIKTGSSSTGSPSVLAPTTPSMPVPQGAIQQRTVAHTPIQSNNQGWRNEPTSSVTNTSKPAHMNPTSLGWSVELAAGAAAPNQPAPSILRGATPKVAANQPYQAVPAAAASSHVNSRIAAPQSPHERKATQDSGWGDGNLSKPAQSQNHDGVAAQGIPASQTVVINGWTVTKPSAGSSIPLQDSVAPLVQSMNSMQLTSGNSLPSDHSKPASVTSPSFNPARDVPTSNGFSGSTGWQTGFQAAPSTHTPTATGGGIGWGDEPSRPNDAPARENSTFNNGGGGNGYSGGYGAPAERRFPGAAGSWASGPNEIPLRHNKWVSRTGGRPGDDVHRPVVPQAIPGSGW